MPQKIEREKKKNFEVPSLLHGPDVDVLSKLITKLYLVIESSDSECTTFIRDLRVA